MESRDSDSTDNHYLIVECDRPRSELVTSANQLRGQGSLVVSDSYSWPTSQGAETDVLGAGKRTQVLVSIRSRGDLGPSSVTYLGIASGVIMALIYSMAYIDETSAHRLIKHGYPADIGREVRRRRSKRAADQEHYNAVYRLPPNL